MASIWCKLITYLRRYTYIHIFTIFLILAFWNMNCLFKIISSSIAVFVIFVYQKRCPSVHSSSFLLEPQFCSWNYTSIYGAPQLSNPIQSHAWLLASLISQKLACSLFSHLLPTPSQLLSPQTILQLLGLCGLKKKKLSSTSAQFQQGDYFCTLPIHPLPFISLLII